MTQSVLYILIKGKERSPKANCVTAKHLTVLVNFIFVGTCYFRTRHSVS